MKTIKIIIISIFVLSGILIALLFRQKLKRIEVQLNKQASGWNPVAIKKIVIKRAGKGPVMLTKTDGVWKTNSKFDGMGAASQIILYLSTIRIENSKESHIQDFQADTISLRTFDKNSFGINNLTIGKEIAPGVCVARLNNETTVKILYSNLNNKSLRMLLDSLI